MPAPAGLPLVAGSVPWVVVGPLSVVVGAGLLAARSRRVTGEERRQLSWAVGAAGVLALLLLATPAVDRLSPALQTGSFLAVVSVLPFVLLAGLVRYRLMDVDLYVARTLARGVVVLLVLSAYALLAGLAGRAGAVVPAALAVVAALTGMPLVRRLERLVDRWLSGGRVRGRELLRRLSDQLTAPSPAEQARRAAQTVRIGLDASWVRLVTGELDLVVGAPPPGAAADVVTPLVAGSTAIGRLECGPRHGGWGPAETGELALLARHVALALHNSELAGRLEQQVVELTASRRRIVRAELAVRKRLERDLHDGVQQQVVAVIAHLGALRVLVDDQPRTAGVAGTALDQARAALTELRHVVDGVQPPVLLDQGLVAAVESRAALLPVPVRVDRDAGVVRWPPDLESAAYYVVSEALTNVVKHAQAGSAEVSVGQEAGDLVVRIRDDGVGLPAGARGSGLAGLRDRVEAFGGRLDLYSAGAGTGTTVTARLPLGPVAGG
jgi:signal transduction histidine kinase